MHRLFASHTTYIHKGPQHRAVGVHRGSGFRGATVHTVSIQEKKGLISLFFIFNLLICVYIVWAISPPS
jgi:hypothetical protein